MSFMPAKLVLKTQASMAHACKPSYSGDGDQEDCSLKPAGQIVCKILSWKKPITKRGAGGVAQGADPEKKSQYQKLKKKIKKELGVWLK
jgi:hypothetical protein